MSEELPEERSKNGETKAGWVNFDEETTEKKSPSKLSTSSGVSSARGSVNSINNRDPLTASASIDVSEVQVVDEETLRKKSLKSSAENSRRESSSSMDNVNLSEQQPTATTTTNRGRVFNNGDAIVTLLPVNERFPWITPARFRPELVPEELMAPVLTLTVEEYVQAMEKLTTDTRFTVYNICYKRILIFWIVTAFTILLALLFSGFKGVDLFVCGVAWLVLNAAAIFFCMWVKLKLNKQLEACMASVNANLIKHKILLGLDDRGKLSCHKVNLCFMYFDPTDCVKKLEAILAEKPQPASENGGFDRDEYLRNVEQFEDVEVVVSGRNAVRIDRKSERAEKLFLHYAQRWAKDYLRRRLDWVVDDLYGRSDYTANTNPRHLRTALCPCQYIEEHLRNKRQREQLNPCTISSNPCHWCQ